MRYFIKLSYNGSSFHGWQIQPQACSVQETIEEALSTLLRSKISLTGAGRTDTGVNAIAYIAHFDTESVVDAANLCYKLNAILPKSIVIHNIEKVDDNLHARFDASQRKYTYFLHRVKDPFVDTFSYHCGYPDIDFELMNKVASLLLGTHDFCCFEKTGADNKTSICTVSEASWQPYKPFPAAWDAVSESGEHNYWTFQIVADRFLRNMVRAIVGTLIEVGRGKRSIEDFAKLILPASTEIPSEASSATPTATPAATPAASATSPKTASETFPASAAASETSPKTASETPPASAPTASASKPSRSLAGESVPGHALFLTEVSYKG